MTTKLKIIVGFLIMMLLLASIAFLGYESNRRASRSFAEYERLALFNTTTSDIVSSMQEAAAAFYAYNSSRDSEHIEASRRALENGLREIGKAQGVAATEQSKAALLDMVREIQNLNQLKDALHKDVVAAVDSYEKAVLPESRAIIDTLKRMAGLGMQAQSLSTLLGITEIWDDFAAVLASVSKYMQSFSPEDAAQARRNFSTMLGGVNDLRPAMQAGGGMALFNDLHARLAALNAAFDGMESAGQTAARTLQALDASLDKQIGAAAALNTAIGKQMQEYGDTVHDVTRQTQKTIIVLSAIGILLGALAAGLIVFGLIKVLARMAEFATAVSQGNFDHPAGIREGGEIGRTLNALQAIPEVLRKLIRQTNQMSESIRTGTFRARLDQKDFPGTFSDLASSVNTVCDAYTRTMDSIPLPILTCDKDLNMLYLNDATQKVFGGNFMGEQCGEHFKSSLCGTDRCSGMCACRSDGVYEVETDVHPQGRDMIVAVTALPLYTAQGEVCGHIEICSDMTEIRAKEQTILEVADHASAIADRVAAAAEEIAAQVEEISRGAGIQHDRVTSTASAMTQMNATVLEVARNAGDASDQSSNTKAKAENGAGLVERVVASINQVNTSASSLEQSMQELGLQAENIGGVMNVISDVADQTNLLALNAAIEAARAGEAGRGFAVVADEVRKLAERTMAATQEVGTGISAIQQSARNNINEMTEAVKSVTQATELANSSGAALAEIVELASSTSAVVTSIATAAEEQSATSEEINHSIEEINRIVAETTEGITQSSAAVQELSRMAQELRGVMEELGRHH